MMDREKLKKYIYKCENIEDIVTLSKVYERSLSNSNPVVYAEIDFENKLFDILKHKIDTNKISWPDKISGVLHIITVPYNSGGHTRLCEKLADIDADLLISGNEFVFDGLVNRLSTYFRNVYQIETCSVESRILAIIHRCAMYDNVILHIHPNDITTCIAIGILKRCDYSFSVYFVNHADHVFSFGKSISDVVLHISNRGYQIDKIIKNAKYKVSFIGIPIDMKEMPKLKTDIRNFLMSGASYKMKPDELYSAPRVVQSILGSDKKNKVMIIGAKGSDYWWWSTKIKYWRRLKIHEQLPYESYIAKISIADAIIDTLPITGGTAFTESYLNGLFPIGIKTAISGYSPLDQIKLESVCNDTFQLHQEVQAKLYKEVKIIHDPIRVKVRFNCALRREYHDVPEVLKYGVNNVNALCNKQKPYLGRQLFKEIITMRTISYKIKLKIIFGLFDSIRTSLEMLKKLIDK
ncbi:hypothetical protein [Photobacterium indicum]|uniref:Glycosyltransferase subfamily 4-like N-terminal domain-containing protein n=1 Tax=Photobacterium indicum TaxID=81447 RepID=A0A2T3L7Z6_9GAMM|nr:hypothetical protein [Photobacterium indicum]PSV46785.1 hypothetical protein C9J47_13415 [Photobacterium indicum]